VHCKLAKVFENLAHAQSTLYWIIAMLVASGFEIEFQ